MCKARNASVLVICWLFTAAPQAFCAKSYSLSQYREELECLVVLAKQARGDQGTANCAVKDLQGGWRVEVTEQAFTIDTSWMAEQFEKLKRNPDSEVYDQLILYLVALKAEAEAFQREPLDISSTRATLKQILSRSEFHHVRGPNWLDRAILKIELWIARLLARSLGSSSVGSSSVPTVGRIFVYTLMAVALGVLAFLVYRSVAHSATLESVVAAVQPVSAKHWRVWIEEAQTAAQNGLWRDAVHLAYWAGITFLEENGMWRPDQARTPREYLTLLARESKERSALVVLTRQLERTWYGKEPAGPKAFQETLAQLQKLGCGPA